MIKDSTYKKLAKGGPIDVSALRDELLRIPVKSKWLLDLCNKDVAYPLDNYEVIKPEKIHYEYDLRDAGSDWSNASSYYLQTIQKQKERDMLLLEKAGIPVFVDDNTEAKFVHDHYGSRITATYQIPEQLMYKSFWVLHSFSKATEYAGQYAMSKVQEVIDKY